MSVSVCLIFVLYTWPQFSVYPHKIWHVAYGNGEWVNDCRSDLQAYAQQARIGMLNGSNTVLGPYYFLGHNLSLEYAKLGISNLVCCYTEDY